MTSSSFGYRGFVFTSLNDGWHFQRILTRQVWGPFSTEAIALAAADATLDYWLKEEQLREELANGDGVDEDAPMECQVHSDPTDEDEDGD